MSDAKFQKLMDQCGRSTARHKVIKDRFDEAVIERYGIHYSDIDADGLIDIFDYLGGSMTIAEADQEMTSKGYPSSKEEE